MIFQKLSLFALLPLLLQYTLALNILISLSNLWVSKNTRYLQKHLEENGHNVVLVAPAYNHRSIDKKHVDNHSPKRSYSGILETSELLNGGDFGHLLEVNTRQYSSLRPRGVRIESDDHANDNNDQAHKKVVQNRFFGQDPTNRDAWYVNLIPSLALLIAFDIILPTYYPDLKIDLTIIGPEEGSFITPQFISPSRLFGEQYANLEEMAQLLMAKNITVMSFSTEDDDHVYFQNEMYFPTNKNHLRFRNRKNRMNKSIRFINNKIVDLIGQVQKKKGFYDDSKPFWVNTNFPSTNKDSSRCWTSRRFPEENPNFQMVSFIEGDSRVLRLPKFELGATREIEMNGEYGLNIDNQEILYPALLQQDRPDYVDVSSYYYKYRTGSEKKSEDTTNRQDYTDNEDLRKVLSSDDMESDILFNCGISVTINTLDKRGVIGIVDIE